MASSRSTATEKPPINLLRGWPSPSLIPAQALKEASQVVLSDASIYIPALQYGPDPGYQPLREELARWLAELYSAPADPERICITGGASQNLACILQSFTDPEYTRAVWMVAPCYYLACPIFADSGFGGRMKAVPEDAEGIDLGYLEKGLQRLDAENPVGDPRFKDPHQRKVYRHIIYIVPTCSNPSGKSMSLRRRTELVHLARKHNALVVCDDVYDCLQWPVAGEATSRAQDVPLEHLLPRLCDIERSLEPTEDDPQHFGHTVSNGSFSKIVGPGIRTGWAEATPAFAYGLSQTGSTRSGGCASQLGAVMAWNLLQSGALDKHLLTTTRPALQRRHQLLMKTVHKEVSEFGISVIETNRADRDLYGGYFVWISLPPAFDSAAVAKQAMKDQKLIIGHGAMFEVHGDEEPARFKNHIRLSFSWESEENIVEGGTRLGQVLKHYRDEKEVGANPEATGQKTAAQRRLENSYK